MAADPLLGTWPREHLMAKGLKVTGLIELRKKMRRLARKFPKEFKDQVRASTINVDRNAKRFTPVDTGRLRSSIRHEFSDGGLTGEVTANTNYAAFVELGTSKQDPQPFLDPAFRLEVSRFEDQLIDRIIEMLRRA